MPSNNAGFLRRTNRCKRIVRESGHHAGDTSRALDLTTRSGSGSTRVLHPIEACGSVPCN